MLLEVDRDKWNMFNISVKPQRRRVDFVPYFEPFRRLNTNEITCITRSEEMSEALAFAGSHEFKVSYQALTVYNLQYNRQ